jgi:hypothetical protein
MVHHDLLHRDHHDDVAGLLVPTPLLSDNHNFIQPMKIPLVRISICLTVSIAVGYFFSVEYSLIFQGKPGYLTKAVKSPSISATVHNKTSSLFNNTQDQQLTETLSTNNMANNSGTSQGDDDPKWFTIPPPRNNATRNGRTTVIVTSNLIPTHPSIFMINQTIQSILKYIHGLEKDYDLVITVDGIKRSLRSPQNRLRLKQYLRNLRSHYANATVLYPAIRSMGLSRNVLNALQQVHTEYVYLLQHDMPFLRDINHSLLMETSRAAGSIPFNVRFNLRTNQRIGPLLAHSECWNATTRLSHDQQGNVEFTKTGSWSDK